MPHVLQHLLPAEVLRKANALAQAFERDRFFRSYVVRQMWIIFPGVLIAMGFIAAILFAAGASALGWFAQPVIPAIRYGIVAIGLALWFAGSMLFIYLVLSRMQSDARRAQEDQARETEGARQAAASGDRAVPQAARRSRLRPWIYTLILFVVAGFVLNWMVGSAYAERRVKAACARIQAGMSFTELEEIAARHGLLQPRSGSGTIYLADRSSFGRHACKVTLEQGVVKHSEYNYAD